MSEEVKSTEQDIKTSKLSIASLILILLGPLPPIICGHIALSKIKRSSGSLGGKGLAVAAIVIGWVYLVGIVIAMILGIYS